MAEAAAKEQTQVEERRHPALYFTDGDIVISATSKDKSFVEFYRVDKIFLSRHSKVFAGMFSLPTAPGVHDEYEGVPMVRLFGDDPVGLEDLLKFLYDPS